MSASWVPSSSHSLSQVTPHCHQQNVIVQGDHQQGWSVGITPKCGLLSEAECMSICQMMHFAICPNWQHAYLVLSEISLAWKKDYTYYYYSVRPQKASHLSIHLSQRWVMSDHNGSWNWSLIKQWPVTVDWALQIWHHLQSYTRGDIYIYKGIQNCAISSTVTDRIVIRLHVWTG